DLIVRGVLLNLLLQENDGCVPGCRALAIILGAGEDLGESGPNLIRNLERGMPIDQGIHALKCGCADRESLGRRIGLAENDRAEARMSGMRKARREKRAGDPVLGERASGARRGITTVSDG